MKTRINSFIIGMVIFAMTSIAGISQENIIDLKTPEIQQQMFSQILNDKELMQSFVVQLQKNEDAMDVMMSSIMMKCCTDSIMCKNLSKKISDHDQILEQLGKVLLEKDDAKYTINPLPIIKHK